ESRLVPHAPGNEQRATIVDVQQRRHSFLDPEPLAAVQLVDGLKILVVVAPARIVGVDNAIAASAKFAERGRLACSRNAGHQDPCHGINLSRSSYGLTGCTSVTTRRHTR